MVLVASTTITHAGPAGAGALTSQVNDSGDNYNEADEPLTALQSNKEVDITLIAARLKQLVLLADGLADVTLTTNNSGSPVDTILLKAGKARHWSVAAGDVMPFSVDVTKLFLTGTTAAQASVVRIRILQIAAA